MEGKRIVAMPLFEWMLLEKQQNQGRNFTFRPMSPDEKIVISRYIDAIKAQIVTDL